MDGPTNRRNNWRIGLSNRVYACKNIATRPLFPLSLNPGRMKVIKLLLIDAFHDLEGLGQLSYSRRGMKSVKISASVKDLYLSSCVEFNKSLWWMDNSSVGSSTHLPSGLSFFSRVLRDSTPRFVRPSIHLSIHISVHHIFLFFFCDH